MEKKVVDIFMAFEKYVNLKVFILVLLSSFTFSPELNDDASLERLKRIDCCRKIIISPWRILSHFLVVFLAFSEFIFSRENVLYKSPRQKPG